MFPKLLWTTFVIYIQEKKLRRQRMGNRWKLKLEWHNIHKMLWSRIHLPLSQSVSVFMSLIPTCRMAKSFPLPYCIWWSLADSCNNQWQDKSLGYKWPHQIVYHNTAQWHSKLKKGLCTMDIWCWLFKVCNVSSTWSLPYRDPSSP